MSAALDGLRVLDLSRVLAGPWASQLLADYGCEVIKVERPGSGDDTRQWGPPFAAGTGTARGDAAYFLSANRNKQSITVNLADPDGQAVIRELAAACDIVIENFRPGQLERYGIGAGALRSVNNRLIYCSISAFGQDGPRAGEGGYDAMIQASGGLMSVTGEPDGAPQKVGVAVADIMAGMYATTAILAALHSRAQSGVGQVIDVPLFDSQLAWLANQAMNYLVSGDVPGRHGTGHPNIVPYQAFPTADGYLMLAIGNDRQFARCCACLEIAALAADARFATNAARVEHRESLVGELTERFRTRATGHWLHALADVGVPCGPINDLAAAFGEPQVAARNMVQTLRRSDGSAVPTVANPVRFSDTPVALRSAPPRLGEHTDAVLSGILGYSPDRIAALRSNGTV